MGLPVMGDDHMVFPRLQPRSVAILGALSRIRQLGQTWPSIPKLLLPRSSCCEPIYRFCIQRRLAWHLDQGKLSYYFSHGTFVFTRLESGEHPRMYFKYRGHALWKGSGLDNGAGNEQRMIGLTFHTHSIGPTAHETSNVRDLFHD